METNTNNIPTEGMAWSKKYVERAFPALQYIL